MSQIRVSALRQRGMALIVSLILLMVMTLLGLAAMQNTSLEERMAGNFRSENLAFQSSESALRAGEAWIAGLASQPAASSLPAKPPSGQVWAADAPDPAATNLTWWLESNADWWRDYAQPYPHGSSLTYLAATAVTSEQPLPIAPRFAIEQSGFIRDTLVVGQEQDYSGRWFYQVTSRGVDAGGRGEVMLRSTFARRF